MMDAGQMRQRITIQQPTETQDATGGSVTTWQPLVPTWAFVKQLSGRELWYAQQVTPLSTHEVHIRYYPGITAAMRVLWGTRTLQIANVNNVGGRNIELVLTCQELT